MLQPGSKITIERVSNGFVVQPDYSHSDRTRLYDASEIMVFQDLYKLTSFLDTHFAEVTA